MGSSQGPISPVQAHCLPLRVCVNDKTGGRVLLSPNVDPCLASCSWRDLSHRSKGQSREVRAPTRLLVVESSLCHASKVKYFFLSVDSTIGHKVDPIVKDLPWLRQTPSGYISRFSLSVWDIPLAPVTQGELPWQLLTTKGLPRRKSA